MFNCGGNISTSGRFDLLGDTVISILLIRENPTYEVNVHLEDAHTGQNLWNASVIIDGIERMTDNNGWAFFALEEGSYVATLSKEDFGDATVSILVQGDTSFIYTLKATHADIKFWLKESTTPVNLASVSINGSEIISNSLGIMITQS